MGENQQNLENNKSVSEEPPTKNKLPKHPVEIIKMRKNGGITIPKKIREQLVENEDEALMFAFWQEDNKLIFQKVKEYEIQDLNLVQKEKKASNSSATNATKSPRKRTKKASTKAGPQPELSRYFPFQIDNQEKIASAIESTFYKLVEQPPKIEEAIERIKYVLINYSTGSNTNDARLKNTIILFLADVIEKTKEPSLIEILIYAKDNLIKNIRSQYLREQSLIILVVSALYLKADEVCIDLINRIIRGIQLYKEPYAIMQGFKGLVKELTKSQAPLEESVVNPIKDSILSFIKGFSCPGKNEDDPPIVHAKLSTDSAVQLIDLLQDLHLIEEAETIAKDLLAELPTDDIYIDQVRQKISDLRKIHI
ncbi:hypothetical protein [Candidatus Lokiarchaeum ossiferum]|uniref:hypothetical protein n=1 Tax=Candidatus Lokiarchaeum ossiferum TaxID=2951803 RepID=UPI00352ED477